MHPLLEGRHVRLEPLRLAHSEPLWEVARTVSSPLTNVPSTLEELRAYVDKALRTADHQAYATIDRATGAVVGSTRFFDRQRWDWPAALEQFARNRQELTAVARGRSVGFGAPETNGLALPH